MDDWKDFYVELQGFGICKSVSVGHGSIVYNIRDRCLYLLHVKSVGNVGNLENQGGNVLWRGLCSQCSFDLFLQILRQSLSRGHFDEEDYPLVFSQILAYRETVSDLGHPLDHVDLHAEPWCLELTRIDRKRGDSSCEAAVDVGAS